MADFHHSITIAASPETVFEYLTTNSGLTAWMGHYANLEPEVGGTFAVDIAGHPVRGEYLVVEPPTRIVVSWGFARSEVLPPGGSKVEFRLTRVGEGTRVDLYHTELPDSAVPGHVDGWANFLPRLKVVGAGDDPGEDSWKPLPDR